MTALLFGYDRVRPATPTARALLSVAAAFNVVAAVLVVALARTAPQVLGIEPLYAGQLLYLDLSVLLIAGFGAGYALAGRDLARFWPFVALGAACKCGVAVLALAYFLTGQAGLLVMLLAAGDALFAVLFVRLLRQHGAA
jgi:hypothetical protein